jgi:C1A family cysteine protease
MKAFFAAALTASATALNSVEFEFIKYIAEYNKSYADLAEYNLRFQQFERSLELVIQHNATSSSYRLGLNKFSDWTADEKAALQTEWNITTSDDNVSRSNQATYQPIDWRTMGAVNPIKDQGSCGSCWAFSAVSAVESAWYVAHNYLWSLSEQ